MKKTRSKEPKEYLYGRDWIRLGESNSKSSRKTYYALCLHCFSFYTNHRSIPKHGKVCPYFNNKIEQKNDKEILKIDETNVKQILAHRIYKNHLQYYIQWKDKPEKTWEDLDSFPENMAAAKRYWNTRKKSVPISSSSEEFEASSTTESTSESEESTSTETYSTSDYDSSEESEEESTSTSDEPRETNLAASPVTYVSDEVQTDKIAKIVSAVYENNELKWMVQMGDNTKVISNIEMKTHYLPELVSFYESHLEFF